MSFRNAWIISQKEFLTMRSNKVLIYAYLIIPLLLSIALPLLILHLISKGSSNAFDIAHIEDLMNAFGFFFTIIASMLCSVIAAYSIVGEKVQKSLEPLLATPVSDGEILLGKALSAFIPVILTITLGEAIYMILIDAFTHNLLGYYYFPNLSMVVMLLLVVPVSSILSIEISTIMSSRVSDPRSAYQLSIVVYIPYIVVYVLTEIGMINLTNAVILIIGGIVAAAALALYPLVIKTFNREIILTSWK